MITQTKKFFSAIIVLSLFFAFFSFPFISSAQTLQNPFGGNTEPFDYEETQLTDPSTGGYFDENGNYIYLTGNNGGFSCSPVYIDGSGLGGILDLAGCLLKKTIPILMTLAVIVFMYGIVIYIKNGDNPETRKEGGKAMLYGLVALFVMVSIWALVQVLGATIGVDAIIPQLQEV